MADEPTFVKAMILPHDSVKESPIGYNFGLFAKIYTRFGILLKQNAYLCTR